MDQRIIESEQWILLGSQFIKHGDMLLMPLFGVLLQIIQHDTTMMIVLSERDMTVFKQLHQCRPGDA